MLKDLREARGMTQDELGTAAGVSLNTIQRAEASDTCPWRRTTASDVLSALQRRLPLSLNEEANYVEASGIAQIVAAARSFATEGSGPTQPVATDPRVHTAHHVLQRLIDERGVANVLPALTGIAAAWNIDLPPVPSDEEVNRGPKWTLISAPRRIEDREVQVYSPVPTQAQVEKSKRSAGRADRKGA